MLSDRNGYGLSFTIERTAHMNFRKGDRVKINEYAKQYGIRKSKPFSVGTVYANPFDERYVRVVWDGTKSPQSYSVSFLERIEDRRESLEPPPFAAGMPVAEVTRQDHSQKLALDSQQSDGAACVIDISRCPTLISLVNGQLEDKK